MKFSRVAQGKRARDEVVFTTTDGVECKASMRPILGDLEATVLERALAFAKSRGVGEVNAKPGEPIYELGYEVATIALALIDPDEPEGTSPYFDGGEAQVLQHLDRDRIALLYERHQAFQDTVSPRPRSLDQAEFFAKLLEIAASEEGDDGPFASLRPALLKSFARTLAKQHLISLGLKSNSGSPSETATKTATE